MWPSVRKGEEENIFPYQEEADAMFNSALIYELAVLKQYVEPLLFVLGFLPGEVKMFHNNDVGSDRNSIPNDCRSDFLGQVLVDANSLLHVAVAASMTILSLTSACAAQLRIQPVFFTREVDELPCEDSSVWTHNAAHSVGVNAKVNSKNGLVCEWFRAVSNRFFKGKA